MRDKATTLEVIFCVRCYTDMLYVYTGHLVRSRNGCTWSAGSTNAHLTAGPDGLTDCTTLCWDIIDAIHLYFQPGRDRFVAHCPYQDCYFARHTTSECAQGSALQGLLHSAIIQYTFVHWELELWSVVEVSHLALASLT
jgi:hypothetical protein